MDVLLVLLKKSIDRLQLQNLAARLLTKHISPMLATLHWLPISSRIDSFLYIKPEMAQDWPTSHSHYRLMFLQEPLDHLLLVTLIYKTPPNRKCEIQPSSDLLPNYGTASPKISEWQAHKNMSF